MIQTLIDFILHIDKHLVDITTDYKTWTYLILFIIIFCETGLVVTPFLPGDSLLFAAGSICALEGSPLNFFLLAITVFTAAFLGDNSNYFFGKYLGPVVFEKNYRFLNKSYLEDTQKFFNKHGGKTVIIARFVPIIRTFAPFVAGVGQMKYTRFISFSMAGTLSWIAVFLTAGYFFGSMEIIRKNFSLVTLGIIIISVVPVVLGIIRSRLKK